MRRCKDSNIPFFFIPFTEAVAVAGAAGAAVATASDIFVDSVVLRAGSQPSSLERAPAKIIWPISIA